MLVAANILQGAPSNKPQAQGITNNYVPFNFQPNVIVKNPPKGCEAYGSKPLLNKAKAEAKRLKLANPESTVGSENRIAPPGTSHGERILQDALPELACNRCGGLYKHRDGMRRRGQCPVKTCQRYWCLIGKCNADYPTQKDLLTHQTGAHPNSPPDIYECTICRRRSKIRDGRLHNKCRECEKNGVDTYYCLFEECQQSDTTEAMIINHINIIHGYTKTKFICRYTCQKCNGEKLRGVNATNQRCKTCSMYWCMVNNCHFMVSNLQQLQTHINNEHIAKGHILLPDSNRCGACGTPGKNALRRPAAYIACSNQGCGFDTIWCLEPGCNREFKNADQAQNHQIDH